MSRAKSRNNVDTWRYTELHLLWHLGAFTKTWLKDIEEMEQCKKISQQQSPLEKHPSSHWQCGSVVWASSFGWELVTATTVSTNCLLNAVAWGWSISTVNASSCENVSWVNPKLAASGWSPSPTKLNPPGVAAKSSPHVSQLTEGMALSSYPASSSKMNNYSCIAGKENAKLTFIK